MSHRLSSFQLVCHGFQPAKLRLKLIIAALMTIRRADLLWAIVFIVATLRRDSQVLDDVRVEQLGQRTDLMLGLSELGVRLLLSLAVRLVIGVCLL